jgi:NAD(P)-dependent dehydrogenase (short-subunit alcohol dehydrogenase family)
MARPLTDHVGIVIGAAGGIGRASAVALRRRGASVVVVDLPRRASDAGETVSLVVAAGGKPWFEPVDVTDDAQWKRLIDAALEISGTLDFGSEQFRAFPC